VRVAGARRSGRERGIGVCIAAEWGVFFPERRLAARGCVVRWGDDGVGRMDASERLFFLTIALEGCLRENG